jgi:non-ribosomal peptide synthetase component E (peptide arylation enzyme)
MTEMGGATFTLPDDPPDYPARSDGRPIAWMEVKIVPDPGAPAPDGSGGLRVRGANLCLGYFQRPDVYAACLDDDGWFDTGDLVRPDGSRGIHRRPRQGRHRPQRPEGTRRRGRIGAVRAPQDPPSTGPIACTSSARCR